MSDQLNLKKSMRNSVNLLSGLLITVVSFELVIVLIIVANNLSSVMVHPVFVISQCVWVALTAMISRSLFLEWRKKGNYEEKERSFGGWSDLKTCPRCGGNVETKEFLVSDTLLEKYAEEEDFSDDVELISAWECKVCPECDITLKRRFVQREVDKEGINPNNFSSY